jgi:hypothetical protein
MIILHAAGTIYARDAFPFTRYGLIKGSVRKLGRHGNGNAIWHFKGTPVGPSTSQQ